MTGVLNEAGNPNVDQVVIINTNTGNTFFHRLGQYDQMFVFARSGNDVPTVIQEMDRVYGSDSFGRSPLQQLCKHRSIPRLEAHQAYLACIYYDFRMKGSNMGLSRIEAS